MEKLDEDLAEWSADAESHVDWYLKSVRPLLIDFMLHGFKHGVEWAELHREDDCQCSRQEEA